MAEVNIKGFAGANNAIEQFATDGYAHPRVILNADVTMAGELNKRKGKDLAISMAGAHSLWAGKTCMLFAAAGVLYRNVQGVAANVGSVSGPDTPLFYEEIDEKVYISNRYWQGIYNPAGNTMSSWGIPVPSSPVLLSGSGSLPAGTYHVCMTNVVDGELSGNGPIGTITLATEGGIQVYNRPAGAIVWCTDSDEYVFYRVGAQDAISHIPTVEPLPTFLCSPPPYMDNLCGAFGRIWGSRDNVLYYSEPFQPGLYKLASNKFSFNSTITLVAKVNTGLFVGTEDSTFFLGGTEPSQMVQTEAGAGSIKGTLAYCNNLPDLGDILGTPEKGFVDVPVWMTAEGIVAGNAVGRLFNLTKNKIKTGIPESGASLYRNLEGVFHFLTSFRQGLAGSGAGFLDEDTAYVFKHGQIDSHEQSNELPGSRAGFADSATCRVFRGGVEI